jgi:hypothetical protein
MQAAVREVYGFPFQRHQLAGPEGMPVGDQNQCGVAMAVPIVAGGLDQPINLVRREIFAGGSSRYSVSPSPFPNPDFDQAV